MSNAALIESLAIAHREAMAILESRTLRESEARDAYLAALAELGETGDALAFQDMHQCRAALYRASRLVNQALVAVTNAVLCNPVEKEVA